MFDIKETVINNRFVLGPHLGKGAFGDIYLGNAIYLLKILLIILKIFNFVAINRDTNENVAVKLVKLNLIIGVKNI